MHSGHPCCSCYPRRSSITDLQLNHPRSLQAIDIEISSIEGAIVHLVKRRAALKRQRNTCASRAVNLPPEILALIFEYACLPTSEGDFASSADMGEHSACTIGLTIGIGALSPLFLGAVCSTWRTVAFSTSQLWNRLKIYVGTKDAQCQADLLRDWLARSGRRPLSIKIIEEDVGCNEDDDEEEESDSSSAAWGIDASSTALIDVLAAHSKQWHNMDLFLPCTWRKALTRIRRDLPNLSKLTVRGARFSPSLARVNAFALAPNLRDVSIVNTYLLDDVELPWAQLRRLQAEGLDPTDCLRAIQLCPELRTCELERLGPSIVPPPNISIRHMMLDSLVLSADAATIMSPMLKTLVLPGLQELVISVPQSECVLEGVLPLVRRSQCQLTRLQLVGRTPSEDALMETLRGIVTLEHLLLLNPAIDTGGRLTNALLHHMVGLQAEDDMEEEPRRQPVLLPKLQTFEYQGRIGFCSEELMRFLERRWDFAQGHVGAASMREDPVNGYAVSRLESLIVTTTSCIAFRAVDSAMLCKLKEAGMRLEFSVDSNDVEDDEMDW